MSHLTFTIGITVFNVLIALIASTVVATFSIDTHLLACNQGTKVANLFSTFFHPILLAIRIFIKKYQISYLTAL